MAKRKAARRARKTARAAAAARPRRKSVKASASRKKRQARGASKSARATAPRTKRAKVVKAARATVVKVAEPAAEITHKRPHLDRVRRTLDETVPTPPSSLNLDRRGSAARSGRAEMAASRRRHASMSPDIAGGDLDVDVEDAYFTGEEAPGGDNPTPDQDVVDDIGKALGVEYQDREELKSGDKLTERDRHRWELDPASSEDYKERK